MRYGIVVQERRTIRISRQWCGTTPSKTGGDHLYNWGKSCSRSGTRDIRDHYFNKFENNDFDGVRQAFIDAIGDYLQICPTVYFGEYMAEYANNVYFYLFNHRPSNSYWDEWLG